MSVRHKFLDFMRNRNMAVGHVVPEKPFRFGFVAALNPKEAGEVEVVIKGLVDDGILEAKQSPPSTAASCFLTQKGFDLLYAEAPTTEPQASASQKAAMDSPKAGGTFNFHGATTVQIGNGNTQQIHNYFEHLSKRIDESQASPAEKEESKSLLMKISTNPLLASLLTNVGGAAIRGVLGLP